MKAWQRGVAKAVLCEAPQDAIGHVKCTSSARLPTLLAPSKRAGQLPLGMLCDLIAVNHPVRRVESRAELLHYRL